MNGRGEIIEGTVAKMAVNFRYPADPTITLFNIDFSVDFYCSPLKTVHLAKTDLICEEVTIGNVVKYDWFALVNTAMTGCGRLRMQLNVEIPDEDSPSGTRPMSKVTPTNVIVIPRR